MARPDQLNQMRDNVRSLMAKGTDFQTLQDYMKLFSEETNYSGTLGQLLRMGGGITGEQQEHPDMLPSQQTPAPFAIREASHLPLTKLREDEQRQLRIPNEGEPGRLADNAAMVGMATGGAVAGPAFLGMKGQLVGTTAGAMLGRTAGEFGEMVKQDEPITGEQVTDAVGRVFKSGAKNVGFVSATAGLGHLLGFLRGAGPTKLQQKGIEHAKKTTFEGRKLPAQARDFASASTAGHISKFVTDMTAAGRTFARQQSEKVGRYIDQQLTKFMAQKSIGGGKLRVEIGGSTDPSNVAERVASYVGKSLVPNTGGAMKRRAIQFAQGVGRGGGDEPGPYIEKLFSEANQDILRAIKANKPELFDDLVTGWLTTAIRNNPGKGGTSQFLTVDGVGFRLWFDQNLSLMRKVLPADMVKVLDGFSAYAMFATKLTERGVQRAAEGALKTGAGPAAGNTGAALLATAVAPGAGPAGPVAYELAGGALAYALSRPDSSLGIYQLFSKPFTQAMPHLSKVATGLRHLGQAGIQLPPEAVNLYAPYGRQQYEKPARRERRAGDVRYTAPSFPPRAPR